MPSDQEIEEQRKKVEARVQQELAQYPDEKVVNEEGELDLDFIKLCYHASELGDATIYARKNKGKVAFNPLAGRDGGWMKYTGPHWEPDWLGRAWILIEETVVPEYLRLLDSVSAEIKAADDNSIEKILKKQRKNILARIQGLRTSAGRASVLKYLQRNDEAPLAIFEKDCDLHPLLLPCLNGVVNLETGEFSDKPCPELFLTRTTACNWTGLDTPAPNFERFVLTILDEKKEVAACLQRLLGYAASGLRSERFFAILFGARGQNGKGVLIEALAEVMGDLATPLQSEMLLSSKIAKGSGAPSPEILNLRGRRLVWASETEEAAHFAAGRVKWLSGGDTLTGRNLNDRDHTSFRPTHSLFLVTNYKPGAPAHDSAFWERTFIFDFPLSFVRRDPAQGEEYAAWERPAIRDMQAILLQEKEGILAWLVRGFLEFKRLGLAPPAEVLKWRQEYRDHEDLISEFVGECCEEKPGERESAKILYGRFREWWDEISPNRPISRKRFGDLMGHRFEKIKSNGSMFYLGVIVDILGRSTPPLPTPAA